MTTRSIIIVLKNRLVNRSVSRQLLISPPPPTASINYNKKFSQQFNQTHHDTKFTTIATTTPKLLRVVFFGSDFFSVRVLRVLKRLVDEKHLAEISVVTSVKTSLTKEENNNNRSHDFERENQVRDVCVQKNINYHLWSSMAKNDDYLDVLKGYDVGVLASFGHLIPSKLINLFP